MPAALIDSTIVLRLLAARLVGGVTGADVTQLGEAPVKAIALGGVEIRFLALNIVRERRSFADAAPSDGTFEAVIEVVVDADQMEASADNLTRYAMAVVAALDQQRMTDAIAELSKRVGFRSVPGLNERVIYRELFPSGLTLIDKGHLGQLATAHIVARQELRELVTGLALPEVHQAALV